MTSVAAGAAANVRELEALVDRLEEAELEAMAVAWTGASRLFFTGVGRSGLAARAVAMRLMHIGKPVFVVGEIATPAIAPGDLLVAVSSSGRGSIADQARTAVGLGARAAAIVASADNELAALSETMLRLPARTDVPTEQHAGSLFEQAVLVVGDALCRAIQERLHVPTATLVKRHANLL